MLQIHKYITVYKLLSIYETKLLLESIENIDGV